MFAVRDGLRAAVMGCALVIAGASPALAAIADYVGKPVAAVRFVIEGRDTTDPSLSDVIETRVGMPLSMADVRESLVHLYSLGRFDDVRVDATSRHGRERPVRSQPRPPGDRVSRSTGSRRPGRGRGSPAARDRRARRNSLRVGRAAELALAVKDAVRERGYLNAAVTPGVQIAHAPHTTTLIFTIDPGTRTVLGTLNVTGAPGVPAAELLKQLGLATGGPTSAMR